MPEATHPLVRTHPATIAARSISIPTAWSASSGSSCAESDRLLDELIAHATQVKLQYRHAWRQGDIVIWDNRSPCTRPMPDCPEGERRLMHQVIVAGTVPV